MLRFLKFNNNDYFPTTDKKIKYVLQWLRKQAESRRIIELENSDLTEEEKNPVWLRDKGK